MVQKKQLESFANSLWCEVDTMLANGENYARLNSMACLCNQMADILKDGKCADDLKELSHQIYKRLDGFGFYNDVK